MKKFKCLVVDDEPLAIELVESYIEKISYLDCLGSFRNPIEAFEAVQSLEVDLIFLDIQMPELNGLELAGLLKKKPGLQVIFTTAYREYAVESYELQALDYLVKPFSFQRFLEAVEKAKPLQADLSSNQKPPILNIKSEGKTYKVDPEEIEFIESFKDYIKINTKERSLTSYQHISNFQNLLPDGRFLRIHRSFIVNKNKIISFSSSFVNLEKEELPIGRSFKEDVLKELTV